ncbi:MAG: DEAD/DEAH box helicase [Pseudomonadota bacterium]
MPLDAFHPAVAHWFRRTFAAPTEPQARAWPAIREGRHVLIAAPTGSGKTLAAFLAALDALVRQALEEGLKDETQVVYVSPLKALSNDIQRNLELPLIGIGEALEALGLPLVEIRTLVRTGDTPQAERERMRRRPPHILVTTPESLYILATSDSGRKMLATVRSVIVDEIHALAPNKRGAHLALSLERLQALASAKLTRIGLSATQKPIEEVARFLTGGEACTIIDTGYARERDLAIEVPGSPLEAVMSQEVWGQVYDRLAALIEEHRTTLVFVNTRRLAERVARHLSERLGEDRVTSHHGSLSRERRLEAEQRLKRGELKALVATSSLELGIDVGFVDLACQIGSPRSIAGLLQRTGRSGHRVGGVPKGRLFPLSRDDLAECAALLDAVRRDELDRLTIPEKPLDVLAQQIAAEVACREWDEQDLYECYRRAWPYRGLAWEEYRQVVEMLADGFHGKRGRSRAYIHRDAVNRRLKPRRGARLAALTSGGTIPDTADYQVVLEPGGQVVGTVNEDFAVESLAGDVFQLGNVGYRILRVEAGRVRVEDAKDAPPGIPFWLGEAPARTDEVSLAVSRLRAEIEARLAGAAGEEGVARALGWLVGAVGLAPEAATQLVDYYAAARAALGRLPRQDCIVFERFFDELGGQQLVIHSPYGSRVNRAWGLALRKRFCRKFNFELQAAATEDAIVLSLTSAHSFPLEEVVGYLNAREVRKLLTQALLDAPMFVTRWRWDATIALALPRFRGGARVSPQLQRLAAEDLLAAVFPDQVACGENLVGDREIPDHPLVRQAIADCLFEAMDVEGLERLLAALARGEVQVIARDLTSPSPLALEILSARPYAFLDDAPLEERRTQAVVSRRWLDPQTAADLGRLDPEAIARVREEAWPEAETADELHDALLWLGYLSDAEVERQPSWCALLEALARQRRAGRLDLGGARGGLWIAAERLPQFQSLYPERAVTPALEAPPEYAARAWSPEEALTEIVRGRLEGLGPVTARGLAAAGALPAGPVEGALARLEAEGFALRGRFTPGATEDEWCERGLLARIHRYTLKRLRSEIQPVVSGDFLRFLLRWQRLAPEERMQGPDAVAAVIAQLEGFEAPAVAWESEILPARVAGYDPVWLDDLCLAGRVAWMRVDAQRLSPERERVAGPVRATPVTLVLRRHLNHWAKLAPKIDPAALRLSSRARAVLEHLAAHGASFFDEIVDGARLPRTYVEEALGELTAWGLASCDSFAGLRALLLPAGRRRPMGGGGERRRRTALFGIEDAGRWFLVGRLGEPAGRPGAGFDPQAVEHAARTLLKRYGVVFWKLVYREADVLPPWRELLMAYRRLEARGEIRGGRFVDGFAGEQFALPEAVGLLRDTRREEKNGELVCVSGADPLNLVGLLVPGPRVPALAANRVLYRDGAALAVLSAGEARFLETLPAARQWELAHVLLKSHAPPALARLL